jgi:hypothetical protein
MRAALLALLVLAVAGPRRAGAMPALWVRRLRAGAGRAGGACNAHPAEGASYGRHGAVAFDPDIAIAVSDARGPRADVCPGGEYALEAGPP